MATHEIRVDHRRPVREEPDRCHNRWHPDIPAALTCEPGDEIVMETRDAIDGQITSDSGNGDLVRIDRSIVHPLTGPVRVRGAEAGDVLSVEVLDVVPGSFGYTAQFPGFGFLSDEFPEPFLVRWEIADGGATSPDLPRVRIPGAPFMGTMGVAPSRALLQEMSRRERELKEQGADVVLPDPRGAVPADEPIASEGLRTKPPRENGGNMDVKQMVVGSRILFPVWREGALFSAGDGHFAQGDGESCGTAIETRATFRVRLDLRKGEAAETGIRDVRFESPGADPRAAARPSLTTTGLCVYANDAGRPEDLTTAARNALRNMIEHLVHEYGHTRQQAYAICSVAVDLSVGEVVDAPNYVATATVALDLGPDGARSIPSPEFFVSYFTNSLQPNEMVTEVRLRIPDGRVGSAFLELARRQGDFALAGAATLLSLSNNGQIQEARIALIGVGETARRISAAENLLVGESPTEALFESAASEVGAVIDPPTDAQASGAYRRSIARVLVLRALRLARDRAER